MRRANFFGTTFGKRMLRRTTYQLTLTAVFSALVLLSTMVLAIPIPATGGFVNIGDTLIFTGAVLFGPFVGGIAGGFGSMLADLILGYGFYAPFTLIIKGLEGAICGLLGYLLARKFKKKPLQYAIQFCALLISSLIMVTGYFLLELSTLGAGVAVVGLSGNFIQAFSSVAIASALLFFCKLGERVVKNNVIPKHTAKPTLPSTLKAEQKNVDLDNTPILSDTTENSPAKADDLAGGDTGSTI